MLITAKSNFIRISPRKARRIASAVKCLPLAVAVSQLETMPRVAATPILKTIKQGMANATHNLRLDPKTLVLKNILVDEGRSAKRMDKSHGSRFDRGIIHKRSSNITVILESKEAKNGAKS